MNTTDTLLVRPGPTVVWARNPMDPYKREVFQGKAGLSLRELQPKDGLPHICFYNGHIAHPDDWDWVPSCGDHIAYASLPQGGGGGSQTILGIVLIVASIWFFGGIGTKIGLAMMVGGAALTVSGLMAPPVPSLATDSQTPAASPTYSLDLSGNSARVGQPLPVPYGRHILMPDFACQSYVEYDNVTGDQYYHAVFCLGQLGDTYTHESTMIDDTELSHFEDVQSQFISPTSMLPLTLVNPAVVNAPEVAGIDLHYGTISGPFAACGQGLKANAIGIDIIFPKGLYFASDSGALTSKTCKWLVEARRITDGGAVASEWYLLGSEKYTAATNTPIRRSYKYAVIPGRYEVKVSRYDEEDTNARAGHALQWGAMRSYLDVIVPMEPSATYMALRIRANSQLSGLTQRKISVIIRRWLPTWHPDTGWSAPVETRSIAWALADVLRNPIYGAGVPDNRIDLQSLYELDQLWAERGDTFNAVFDKKVTLWAALQTVARCGRARPIMRGSIFTFVRDTKPDLPVAFFNMRSTKNFKVSYSLTPEDAADGVEVSFFNEQTWATDYARVPLPGIEESVNPSTLNIMGITNMVQAMQEAKYVAADSTFRREQISFQTEMEGFLPGFGSLIAVSHDVVGWGTSAEAVSWNASEHLMVITEPVTWGSGNHYAMMSDKHGKPRGPYLVVPGQLPNSVSFVDIPTGFEIYTGTEMDRTRISVGEAETFVKMCKVVSMSPIDSLKVQIGAVVDDNRVYDADGIIPGGPGGPGGRRARYSPDDIPAYDAASQAQHDSWAFYSTAERTVGSANDEGYSYD